MVFCLKWSHLFGQFRSFSKVYRVSVSCCFWLFQAGPICLVRRSPIKRGMGPLVVVECHPVFHDPSGLEAVIDLFEIDCFLLQAPPQPLDEDVVEVNGLPRACAIDKSGANTAGWNGMNVALCDAGSSRRIRVYRSKYLNNIVEKDHRATPSSRLYASKRAEYLE